MGALPKQKPSKGRRDRRRNHHRLARPNLIVCDNCGAMKRPHVVCLECGFYRGREIVESEF